MNTPFALIALCTGALWLGACDKTPTTPATPMVNTPVPNEPATATGAVANTSVPPAESVLPASNAAKADPTLGRSNSTMSAAQESAAMPLPGQNNDHSAALGPAKRASAP